jgi:hypothetical protein
MSFRPGLLWLSLYLTLIIQCLSRNNILLFSFTYSVGCLRVLPRVRVPRLKTTALLATVLHFSLGADFFYPEDGGETLLRNVDL